MAASARPIPTSRRLIRWLPAILWMMAIFYGSSQSTLPIDGHPAEALFHRVAHVVEYAVLAALLVLGAGWSRRALWMAFAIAAFFSVTDEVHQAFVPGRHGRAQEILLDSASAAAVLVAVAVRGRVASQRQRGSARWR